MVFLKRSRKSTTEKKVESARQPMITPAQRILQQQWLQPASSRTKTTAPKLPKGTEICLVAKPKRAKLESKTVPGTRVVPVDESTSDCREMIKSMSVVPSLLSPISIGGDTSDAKMASVSAKEAVTAHPSSRETPSKNVGDVPRAAIAVAVVRVPSDTVHEQTNRSRSDNNEGSRSISQEEHDSKFTEMVNWKRDCDERIATARKQVETEALRAAVLLRELEASNQRSREAEQVLEKLVPRLTAFENLFQKK